VEQASFWTSSKLKASVLGAAAFLFVVGLGLALFPSFSHFVQIERVGAGQALIEVQNQSTGEWEEVEARELVVDGLIRVTTEPGVSVTLTFADGYQVRVLPDSVIVIDRRGWRPAVDLNWGFAEVKSAADQPALVQAASPRSSRPKELTDRLQKRAHLAAPTPREAPPTTPTPIVAVATPTPRPDPWFDRRVIRVSPTDGEIVWIDADFLGPGQNKSQSSVREPVRMSLVAEWNQPTDVQEAMARVNGQSQRLLPRPTVEQESMVGPLDSRARTWATEIREFDMSSGIPQQVAWQIEDRAGFLRAGPYQFVISPDIPPLGLRFVEKPVEGAGDVVVVEFSDPTPSSSHLLELLGQEASLKGKRIELPVKSGDVLPRTIEAGEWSARVRGLHSSRRSERWSEPRSIVFHPREVSLPVPQLKASFPKQWRPEMKEENVGLAELVSTRPRWAETLEWTTGPEVSDVRRVNAGSSVKLIGAIPRPGALSVRARWVDVKGRAGPWSEDTKGFLFLGPPQLKAARLDRDGEHSVFELHDFVWPAVARLEWRVGARADYALISRSAAPRVRVREKPDDRFLVRARFETPEGEPLSDWSSSQNWLPADFARDWIRSQSDQSSSPHQLVLDPANGADLVVLGRSKGHIRLSWSWRRSPRRTASTGHDGPWNVQISQDPSFLKDVTDLTVKSRSTLFIPPAERGGSWYWRVRPSVNGATWSPIHQFEIKSPAKR
jgi:hypothetical protein